MQNCVYLTTYINQIPDTLKVTEQENLQGQIYHIPQLYRESEDVNLYQLKGLLYLEFDVYTV